MNAGSTDLGSTTYTGNTSLLTGVLGTSGGLGSVLSATARQGQPFSDQFTAGFPVSALTGTTTGATFTTSTGSTLTIVNPGLLSSLPVNALTGQLLLDSF